MKYNEIRALWLCVVDQQPRFKEVENQPQQQPPKTTNRDVHQARIWTTTHKETVESPPVQESLIH